MLARSLLTLMSDEMEEANAADGCVEDPPVTVLTLQNALQHELGRFRETLAADIKGQTADIQRQMQSMRDEIKEEPHNTRFVVR